MLKKVFKMAKYPPYLFSVVGGIAVGVTLAVVIISTGTSNTPQADSADQTYQHGASLVPPPQSMSELVRIADVIVIGNVKSIANEVMIGSYNEADNIRNEKPDDPVTSHIPATDFELEVEEVILDDGTIASGKPLVLRVLGRADVQKRYPSIHPMPQLGDHRLFVLTRNPDDRTYGSYGWWSNFVIDTAEVTYADDLRTPVEFTTKVKPAEFIQELELATSNPNDR